MNSRFHREHNTPWRLTESRARTGLRRSTRGSHQRVTTESWGLPGGFDHVVQTGVLVLSPKHHREILEHVYHSYDDRGAPIWHYEMRPLSYELIRGGLVDWVDSRFNSLWVYVKAVHYPWLLEDKYPRLKRHKGGRRIANRLDEARLREPVAAALLNSYFLHFASSPYDIRAVRIMVQSES